MAAVASQSNYGSHDPKSLAINLISFIWFVTPFIVYFSVKREEQLQQSQQQQDRIPFHWYYLAASVTVSFAGYFVKPIGWRRPHPYSDDPRNVPVSWGSRKTS